MAAPRLVVDTPAAGSSHTMSGYSGGRLNIVCHL